ncbi:hypothetical protein MMC26_003725 [Xylographa opegraphella]|nr:hypothetical protein [Xylographa opegraphella]
MATTLLRPSTARTALRFSVPRKTAPLASLSFTRSKITLPDLPCTLLLPLPPNNHLPYQLTLPFPFPTLDAYSALEPSISREIMELHHAKHHQTYVTSYNTFAEQMDAAIAAGDVAAALALQPMLNFHGGGHVNHSLFWENLAPAGEEGGGGAPPQGALAAAIDETYGGYAKLQDVMEKALASVQGSGWAWLVRDTVTGGVGVRTYAANTLFVWAVQNQDPVVGQFRPLLGIDAWEHAYYLQYQNRKVDYFQAIWNVVNWKAAEKRYEQIG